MRILGLIPARGGSKGVPRKNIRLVAGKPLLEYTADAALTALAGGTLSRVILSTEDEEIAQVGRQCGLDVPFMRPAALARDDTHSLAVIQHAIRFLQDAGESYDALCLLQPTTPLRTADDIVRAAKLLADTGADSVISLVRVGEHPARMRMVDDEGRVSDLPFVETVEGQTRQTLPPLYLLAGSIYLTRMSVVMEQGTLRGKDSRALIIPEERAINIDTMMDLFLAEHLITLERERSASSRPEAQRTFNSPSRSSTTIQ